MPYKQCLICIRTKGAVILQELTHICAIAPLLLFRILRIVIPGFAIKLNSLLHIANGPICILTKGAVILHNMTHVQLLHFPFVRVVRIVRCHCQLVNSPFVGLVQL
jgi:hypothetical protein